MAIALLTDFDSSNSVGLVKAVMLGTHPKATIVDLCHNVQPFNVRSGAWILLHDYRYFPKGTVFFAVVDPGVGGRRRCVAVRTRNYFFAGPDNGLVYPAANDDGIEEVIELPVPQTATKTFHGRDVFAAAAAKLDAGTELLSLGKKSGMLQQLDVNAHDGNGEVMVVEHYGNIVTNIAAADKANFSVECGSYKRILNYHGAYEEAKDGEVFAITGSRGTLELSVKNGSAAAIVKANAGDRIRIL